MTSRARATKDLLKFMGGSRHRVKLFMKLTEGPVPKSEIKSEFKRGFRRQNLPKYKQRGFLKESNETYELTALGEEVADGFIKFWEIAETVDQLGPLLAAVPQWDERLPNIDVLSSATVVKDNDLFRSQTLKTYNETLNEADHIREIVSWANNSADFHSEMENRTAEYIYSEQIKDYIESDEKLREKAGRYQRNEDASYWVVEEPPDFNLTIAAETVLIWTDRFEESSMAGHTVLLSGSHPELLEWAEEFFEEWQDRAERVTW